MNLSYVVENGWISAAMLLLVAFPLHEAGHLFALTILGEKGRIALRVGLCVEVPVGVQGWRGAVVALAGPGANIVGVWLCLAAGWQAAAQVNFVLAAVNLLPFLPLDGGRALLGLLSGVVSWRRLARGLLFVGRSAALAMAICVYYFCLMKPLLLGALWLYLVSMVEERQLGYVLTAALAENVGKRYRPPRIVVIPVGKPLHMVVARLSPGWRNLIWQGGAWIDGDELIRGGEIDR